MKRARIIVLAGQSNAVGVGFVKCLSKHFDKAEIEKFHAGYPNIKINYYSHDKKSGGFVPVTVGCTEINKFTVGPELGMARYFDRKYPGEEIFIVKCAFGGTNLHRDWASPSASEAYDKDAFANQKPDIIAALGTGEPIRAGWCYNEFVKLFSESISYLEGEGYEPSVCGFCWMQGESDADTPEHAEGYLNRYRALLSDINSLFAGYFEGCVYVDAGISDMWTYYSKINEHKAAHAKNTENSAFIDTIAHGLTTKFEPEEEPDTAHYDSDCVIKLGELFAEQIKL